MFPIECQDQTDEELKSLVFGVLSGIPNQFKTESRLNQINIDVPLAEPGTKTSVKEEAGSDHDFSDLVLNSLEVNLNVDDLPGEYGYSRSNRPGKKTAVAQAIKRLKSATGTDECSSTLRKSQNNKRGPKPKTKSQLLNPNVSIPDEAVKPKVKRIGSKLVKQLNTCPGCQMSFETKDELAKHLPKRKIELADGSKVLQCSLFYTMTEDLAEYAIEAGSAFACKLCKFVGETELDAWNHVDSVHTRMTKFICRHCFHESGTKQGITAHLKTDHELSICRRKDSTVVGEFLCHQCNYKTDRRQCLTRHVKQAHLKIQGFVCQICDKSFSRKYILAKHVSSNTDYNYAGPDNMFCSRYSRMQYDWSTVYKYEPEWDAYTCLKCDTVKNLKSRMEEHVTYKHITFAPYACNKCRHPAKSQREMLEHVRLAHNDTISPLLDLYYGQPKDAFQCSDCDFKGINSLCLKRHVKQEHGPNSLTLRKN